MILSRDEILDAIDREELAIHPFEPSLLGAASLDLRLSSHFRRLIQTEVALDVLPAQDYRDPAISRALTVPEGASIDVAPGETVLGLTMERIRLGERLCGRLEGRSRFARLGLLIHISAGFMAPGTDNQQVLEISNMSQRPLRLHPEVPICQFIFERLERPAQHEGRYRRQTESDFLATPDQ